MLRAAVDTTELRLGTVAVDANDYFIYNSANGQLLYNEKGKAFGGLTLFAFLTPEISVDIGDFVIV